MMDTYNQPLLRIEILQKKTNIQFIWSKVATADHEKSRNLPFLIVDLKLLKSKIIGEGTKVLTEIKQQGILDRKNILFLQVKSIYVIKYNHTGLVIIVSLNIKLIIDLFVNSIYIGLIHRFMEEDRLLKSMLKML